MNRSWLVVLFLACAVGMCSRPLMADHEDHGQKKHHGNKHDDNDQGWERRDVYEYRTYGENDERPPGWSHGKKTGWGNCGMPPGQAKKYGCRTYTYQGRPYYYYQNDARRVIVRRPTIEIHGSVDIVH